MFYFINNAAKIGGSMKNLITKPIFPGRPWFVFHTLVHRRTRSRELTLQTCNTPFIKVKWCRLPMFRMFSVYPDKRWKDVCTKLWGTWGETSRILKPGSKCKLVSRFMFPLLYSPENWSQHTLNKRLGRTQSQ